MEEGFCKSPLETVCLTESSVVSFSNLHQTIESVSPAVHQPMFTTSTAKTNHTNDKTTAGFSENTLPIQLYEDISGSNELVKDTVNRDQLAELCQASDVEDDNVPKLRKDSVKDAISSDQVEEILLPNQSSDKQYEKFGVTGNLETKAASLDPSDASDLLQEIQEENKKRMNDIFTNTIDVPPFHVDEETTLLEMEKLSQEKNTLFSENLGLIAKDSKEFKNLTQTKPSRKRAKTRQSTWCLPSPEDQETVPEVGHKHVKCKYKCGSCVRTFTEMCKLHDHLVNHGHGGSYHYDHILKTAFPKYDSACAFTQTTLEEPVKDTAVDNNMVNNPLLDNGVESKMETVLEKRLAKDDSHEVALSSPTRPKRGGRLRGCGPSKKPKVIKLVTKLRMKTEDGGNTWKGTQIVMDPLPANDLTDETSTIFTEITTSDVKPTNHNEVEKTSLIGDKDIKNDIQLPSLTTNAQSKEGDLSLPERKSRKRKMSVPRKLIPVSSMTGKVNSRSKPRKNISCGFCPSKFQYAKGLMRHEQEKHSEEMTFECEICQMKFMREHNKDRHLLLAHTSGKSSTQQGKETSTVKKKPGRKPREIKPEVDVACEECGKILPHSKAVIHARMHTGDRPFICHFCGKGLISDKKLKRHLLIHSNVNRHTCEVCGQGFSMKYKLKTHMYIHTGHKPYLCSACGAEFNNSTSLLHHHRTVHLGDKRFECKICGGKYGKKSQLEEHMFSHSTERTQTCRYCGKTFKHAKSLRRHESTHVSNNKLQCDQCDSKFSRKDNLERHKMCHFDATLQCRFCKKKFRERAPLEDHEQFHINQKRLQCHICKEKFLDESYFYKHMENQHHMTPDMLPTINILPANGKDDEAVEITLGQDNNLFSLLKLSAGGNRTETGCQSVQQDTVNMSMNAAGIINANNQDLMETVTQSNIQSLLVTQHNAGNQTFNQNSVSLNSSRILNQPVNPGFVASNHQLPGLQEGQRAIVNVVNGDEAIAIRLPLDQSTSEMMMIHEQQRLMQEALGSSLNIQNTGYRLQNMY